MIVVVQVDTIYLMSCAVMKYKVRIIETLSRIVEVEAEDDMDALNTVEDMYCDSQIVLDSEDFDFVDYVIEVE